MPLHSPDGHYIQGFSAAACVAAFTAATRPRHSLRFHQSSPTRLSCATAQRVAGGFRPTRHIFGQLAKISNKDRTSVTSDKQKVALHRARYAAGKEEVLWD
ncbi:hypothetical protein CERZMDRAFT_101851 [Cercospora zeae-maydis SCOH1-5]|uniref:Uncharacterized protein n=1 Tax=Cercospora zeae-maydis SCOH1-5 TaxID=717836 RepID=A0A6A6F3Z5_9PEZI|nr:hypothetical protein CERZMDRAFT_101851 [Cercospora zeae-maydis SCOH1-5]